MYEGGGKDRRDAVLHRKGEITLSTIVPHEKRKKRARCRWGERRGEGKYARGEGRGDFLPEKETRTVHDEYRERGHPGFRSSRGEGLAKISDPSF